MMTILRRARPELQFCLEMITRDPLRVPCLTKPFWATLDMIPGSLLAATLAMVRANPPRQPLPRISELPMSEKLEAEDSAVRTSIAYSRRRLAL
jgi:3-oxoisoapionate decarboxylase